MIKIEHTDGGPAMPFKLQMQAGGILRMGGKSVTLEEGHTEVYSGISKREYFAAAALTGLLANPLIVEATLNAKKGDAMACAKEIREQAFAAADAMLAESGKRQEVMKFPTHKCELSLTHNEHNSYYKSAEKFVAGREGLWKDDESKKRAIDTDEVWQLQWYPRTPGGFHLVMAPTLQELLAFAATFDEGEES